jgi:hypothetical protein
MEVPGHLDSLRAVLRRAYPDGVPGGDYEPLLDFLQRDLSERSLATLVAALTGAEVTAVASDSAAIADAPLSETNRGVARARNRGVARVRARLDASGWDAVGRGFTSKDRQARITRIPEVPDYELEALTVLARMYPDGIPGPEYMPLLAALWRDCSCRGLALTVGHFTGRHYVNVYSDAGGVTSEVSRADADRVWQKLLGCGWIPELPGEDHWPPLRDAPGRAAGGQDLS